MKFLKTALFIDYLRWLLLHCELSLKIKLKYTNGLQLVTSVKSELLHRCFLFPFFAVTSILNTFTQRGAAFTAVLIINEIVNTEILTLPVR